MCYQILCCLGTEVISAITYGRGKAMSDKAWKLVQWMNYECSLIDGSYWHIGGESNWYS